MRVWEIAARCLRGAIPSVNEEKNAITRWPLTKRRGQGHTRFDKLLRAGIEHILDNKKRNDGDRCGRKDYFPPFRFDEIKQLLPIIFSGAAARPEYRSEIKQPEEIDIRPISNLTFAKLPASR